MTNRIIVPANFSIEVVIRLDPVKGQSDMIVRNRSNTQLSMWQIAGLLSEHVAQIMRQLLATGKVKQTPIEEIPAEEMKHSPHTAQPFENVYQNKTCKQCGFSIDDKVMHPEMVVS